MRILIADADEGFLKVAHGYLGKHGHDAVVAQDGLQCVAVLRDFAPEVVVLDRGLLWGGSDGVITCMRETPSLSHVPVLLLTDEAPASDKNGDDHMSDVEWIHRPFWLMDLLAKIDSQSLKTQQVASQTARTKAD